MRTVHYPAALILVACQAATTSQRAAPDPMPEPVAVVAELDRVGAGVWPDFDPRAIPVAIYDGTRTYLFRHPSPPAEFVALPHRADVLVLEGRHPAVTANSSADIGGVATATALPPRAGGTLRQRVALIAHEAFHVHQHARHPAWSANEVELFTYPSADANLLALRRLESEALRRALSAPSRSATRCWTDVALRFRRERFGGMSAGAAEYERKSELNEGLATYVEWRVAGGPDSTLMPRDEFPPEGIRHRVYRSGAALAMLLDRVSPEWKAVLVQNDTVALDVLLHRSLADLPGDSGCAFSASEIQAVRSSAATAVGGLDARLSAQRAAFLTQDGWKLVIVADGAPLFPQGFDPLNVQPVAPGEVLHSRFLKLGNAAGTVEILGTAALTLGAGSHPLFNGVRTVTITGIATEPSVSGSAGQVTIRAEGVQGTLNPAAVERTGRTITIRLNAVR